MNKIETYTQFMEAIAADQSHGYSQVNRWGPDYDCSSLVITALEKAGIPAKTKGATYTGNMLNVLKNIGFKDVTNDVVLNSGIGCRRGDILLNDRHHTAVYVGNGLIVHARGQSYGSSKTGDQGAEIAVTPYYNYPWDHVLRYTDTSRTTGIVGTCDVTLNQMIEGAVSPQVKTIQILLNAKGYKGRNGQPLSIDGELGAQTMYAIEQMQKKAGFPAGTNWGTVAKRTWETLLK